MPRPLCRCCGKPIRKKVVTHSFGHNAYRSDSFRVEHTETAKSREEARRHINAGEIVSCRQSYNGNVMVGVWDGETYAPIWEHFCTNNCAAAYGEFAVRNAPELMTQDYAVALRKQQRG